MKEKSKKMLLFAAIAVFLVAAPIAVRAASQEATLGASYSAAYENQDIIATYKEHSITQAQIEYKSTTANVSSGDNAHIMTDREITNNIILGFILLEEAENENLIATDAEIEETMVFLKEQYKEYPETKTFVDDFCSGAELTIEQYWQQVEEDMYSTISRSKLKGHLKAEYEAETWVPYSKNASFYEAYEEYRADLLTEHSEFITYFD